MNPSDAYNMGRWGALSNCVQTLELLLENYNGNVEYLLEDLRRDIKFHQIELNYEEQAVNVPKGVDYDAYLEGAFRATDADRLDMLTLKSSYVEMDFEEWMGFAYDRLTPGYDYPRPSPEKLNSWVQGFLEVAHVRREWVGQ